tara:strand:+ start:189 stop:1292 length:1104 start_codon:yes stop_codon:yes gene_type:complete
MENVVTKGAKPADPMQTLTHSTPGQASIDDLGGPTPENYKPDDDSAKLKDAGAILKQVKDIVNKSAKSADPMPAGMKKEESESEGEVVVEDEEVTDEVVSEEETSEEEVVSEEETTEESEEEEIIAEINIEEDIEALLAGEELSEEFQQKARTIFEAAITSKIAEVKEEVEQEYEKALTEEISTLKSELTERVDAYLEYVADEWVSENELALERGLKTEMTDSFLTGMKSLFEEHYVSIPEDKYDVLNNMVDKLDEMENKLNEQIDKNVALKKRLSESTSDVIFAEVTEGLAITQKEKLTSLAENVEFESEDNYREKLVTLRDSYFSTEKQKDTAETISESTETGHQPQYSGTMETYLQSLQRVTKK